MEHQPENKKPEQEGNGAEAGEWRNFFSGPEAEKLLASLAETAGDDKVYFELMCKEKVMALRAALDSENDTTVQEWKRSRDLLDLWRKNQGYDNPEEPRL
jgi:hypothetical protein